MMAYMSTNVMHCHNNLCGKTCNITTINGALVSDDVPCPNCGFKTLRIGPYFTEQEKLEMRRKFQAESREE